MLALMILLAGLWTTKTIAEEVARKTMETQAMPTPETLPEPTAAEQTISEITLPEEVTTEPVPEPAPQTEPVTILSFTEEEETLLLKLAMSERGDLECPVCMHRTSRQP